MNEKMQQFRQQVYTVIAAIPQGQVASYGQVARLAGFPGYSRHVGKALGQLPDSSTLPWFRVLNSQGQISLKGTAFVRQRDALIADGVTVSIEGRVNMRRFGWDGE